MITTLVDPRDVRWEEPTPVYRVYFWHQPPIEGVDPDLVGWHCEEWRVTEAADVHEVLAWANGPAGDGRVYELFAEVTNGRGLGLLQLAGECPNPSVES